MPTSEIDDIFSGKASSSKKKSKQIVPEEIVDTSSSLGKPSKNLAKSKPEKKTKLAKNDTPFADSRGTSSRRTTEEGWSIYKEADLGIDPEQGDTPLCPFDCDC
ncbi:DUF1764-domain-containing protein, partial [Flagelloscypha sp. PMI_526]